MKRFLVIFAVFIGILVAAAACGGGAGSTASRPASVSYGSSSTGGGSNGSPAKGVPDGLRLDKNGNIYSSGPGGVWIISPEGKHLGTVKVPEVVSNVAWGDADGKTLYITGSTSVYRVKLSVQGDRKH